MTGKVRLGWFATHPTQYQAPLLRAVAEIPEVDLTALFFSDFSAKPYIDPEFENEVAWDTPLLQGYKHEVLGTSDQNGISLFEPRVRGLSEVLKRGRFDCIMVQGWNHYAYPQAAWLSKRAGARVLLRCEASDHVSHHTGAKRLMREFFIRRYFSLVDRFMAIGSRNRRFYLSRGIAAERIGSMPYCVDNNLFAGGVDTAALDRLRLELELDPNVPIIGYAGKLTRRKNVDVLLEAYALLKHPKPYLLFVGDGELSQSLRERATSLNLDRCRFLGFQNQSRLPIIYALCDIFILPSRDETWGLVVNEAMNAGCAIIASDQVGCADDLVEDGMNGYVVPPGDAVVLAGAIEKSLSNGLYREMGHCSRRLIAKWGIPENVFGLRQTINELFLPQ